MQIEKNISRRFIAFVLAVILCFSVIIAGLYNLQVLSADKYQQDAGSKSVKTLRLTGKRGMITDVDSVVLAMSEDIFNVTFQRNMRQNTREDYVAFTDSILETMDIIEKYGGEVELKFVIERNPETNEWVFNFGKGISEKALEIRSNQWHNNHYMPKSNPKYDTAEKCYNHLVELYDLQDRGLSEEKILQVLAIYSEMQMNLYNSVPIVIAEDIPFAAVSEITGRKMMLPGIDIEIGEKRVYPRGTMASQVVGYVGKISDADNYYEQLKPLGYALNDIIGKEGIEKSMENWLTPNITSRQGSRVMERDNLGRLTRQISYTPPSDGNNVKLTINAAYQQVAEQAIAYNVASTRKVQEKKLVSMDWLEKYRDRLEARDFDKYPLRLAEKGAMMVVDVNTGRVLAMAQYPNYDSNALTAGGAAAIPYLADDRNMMRNLCIQERAEPGSIFKMVTALAALTNGVLTVDEQISDLGAYTRFTNVEEDAPVCWITKNARWKHANQTIIQGIKNSCNYFFYEITGRLYGDTGSNRLYKYAAKMGLTTKTGLQLPNEIRSIVGNQTSLYDPETELQYQETSVPILVAASIKQHLNNVAASYGISYQEESLDRCIKKLMDMAIETHSDKWVEAMRPILMTELNMTRDMVYKRAIMTDLWIYLNDIKWGGSMEVQMGIGQSITLLTPAAVSRYAMSIANGGNVYNLSIVDSVVSPEGEILNKYEPTLSGVLEGAEAYLPYIREGMKGVVDADQGGTAGRHFSRWKYKDNLWAKTGTSQITIGGVQLDVENNGWFIALAPFETPAEVAVVTLIPNGYSGGETVLATKEFLTWWMDNRTKKATDIQVVPGNELMP